MSYSRFLRWVIRLGLIGWVCFWISAIFWKDLGASPALRLNHRMGEVALIVLTANLVLGALLDLWRPLPKWIRPLAQERRFWGVVGFLILTIHVFFYFLNEAFEAKAWTQLVTKWYLIAGLASFGLLLILALTSNDFSVKKMKFKNWKRLHRTVYIAQCLLFFHLLLIEKADLVKYSLWLGLLAAMQVIRFVKRLKNS